MSLALRSPPVVTPNSANCMASNRVVLPPPVGPVIRKTRAALRPVKSIVWVSAQGPKALIRRVSGIDPVADRQ